MLNRYSRQVNHSRSFFERVNVASDRISAEDIRGRREVTSDGTVGKHCIRMLVGMNVGFLQYVPHFLAVFRSLQDGSTNEKRYLCQTRVGACFVAICCVQPDFGRLFGSGASFAIVSPVNHVATRRYRGISWHCFCTVLSQGKASVLNQITFRRTHACLPQCLHNQFRLNQHLPSVASLGPRGMYL